MAETIESFVKKLQTDGVEAGRQEAEKIRQAARDEAQQTADDAKRQAEKIIADAQAEADGMLARAKTELQLASRDAVLRLRDVLARALEAIVAEGTKEKLADANFLGQVLHDLVKLYAESHMGARSAPMTINVTAEMKQKLQEWALSELGHQVVDSLRGKFDIHGTLAATGFEYKIAGATVEVTVESVVATLKDLVGPGLRDVLDQATGEPATGQEG